MNDGDQLMSYRYHTADVFTDRMFGGNQLAVFPDAAGLTEEQMLAITREFNFSETVFVLPPAVREHSRRIRIFTPGRELPFAGHPTVGTAFVLAATGEIPFAGGSERIVLEEIVGPITVLIRGATGKPVYTQLTAARLPEAGDSPLSAGDLARLLGLEAGEVLDGMLRPEMSSCGTPFLFVPLRDADALAGARIQSNVWDEISGSMQIPEMYLITQDLWARDSSAPVSAGIVRARMFAPGMGIAEDPATGGAAAALGGYLSTRADTGDSSLHWTIYQGVEMGRPSKIELEVDRHGGRISAVHVGGESVLVSSGTFHL
jgi:trans-2,3-dihydro-3-hydroxyanthranilate isomerase